MAESILSNVQGKEKVSMADVLEVILANIKEEDFILKKNYTIVKGVSQTYGKWPSIYGNALLLDSNYVLEDLASMFRGNLMEYFQKNGYGTRYNEVAD